MVRRDARQVQILPPHGNLNAGIHPPLTVVAGHINCRIPL